MKLEINPRGNGACPLCVAHDSCRIQRRLTENVDSLGPSSDDEMVIVVYSCPFFKEKTVP